MNTPTSSQKERKKETKHLILETRKSEFFIVSTLSGRNDTQLITISPECGSLFVETLESEDEALNLLVARNFSLKSRTEAKALIGYVLFGNSALLLVATKTRPDMQLFAGHIVNTIEEKQWIKIPLNNYQAITKQEMKNIELMMEFPIEGLHFYCESFDLTRPFPSIHKVVEYDEEFCWNDWMAKSFEKIGMREWCVVLQQGLAISKVLPKYVTACLITRKSVKNPGVRFFARGLNSNGGVGNEMECELILWTGIDGNKVEWNSFVWRRGTVPIHWSSQLKSQVVRESEVIIRDKPYENSELYYSSLIDRYGHDHAHPIVIFNMLRCGPKQEEMVLSEHFQESLKYVKKSLNLDLKLFNFDWHHNIKQLGADKSIEGLWSLLKSSLASIDLNHGSISIVETSDNDKEVGTIFRCPNGRHVEIEKNERQKGIIRYNCADSLDRTNIATFFVSFQLVAEMARRLGVINDSDFNSPSSGSSIVTSMNNNNNNNNSNSSSNSVSISSNNASSGNLSSLLSSVYNNVSNSNIGNSNNSNNNISSIPNPLSEESNNNNTNTLTLENNNNINKQGQAWSAIDKSIDKITNGLRKTGIIECLAEFFVLNGDVCSVLYTNSPAMHSALMRDFSPTISSAPINAVIAIQRRYQNLYLDGARQAQYEMLLGKNVSTHFPFLSNTNGPFSFFSLPSPFSPTTQLHSLSPSIRSKHSPSPSVSRKSIDDQKEHEEHSKELKIKYISSHELISSFPSFILKPIPSVLKLNQISTSSNPENNTSTEILLQDADGYCWICPNEYDIVEMYIYLHEPCYVTELGLTISHGINEDSYPHTIDLFMGTYLDKMHVAFQGLYIPRCASGTKLYYNIPANMWRAYEGSGIYDFDLGSDMTDVSLLTRVVHIVFRGVPQDNYISLGKVEIFGNINRVDSPSRAKSAIKDLYTLSQVESLIKALDEKPLYSASSVDVSKDSNSNNSNANLEIKKEISVPKEKEETGNINNSLNASMKSPIEEYESIIKSKLTGISMNNNNSNNFNHNANNNNVNSNNPALGTSSNKSLPTGLLTFLDTLELEYFRISSNITPQERDTLLLENKFDIESFNPDRFIHPRDEKTELSLRKSSKYKSTKCGNFPECQEGLGIFSQKQCSYCYLRFCSNCISNTPAKIIEFMWEKPQTVCKKCFSILVNQEELLKKIKQLGEKHKIDKFKRKENSHYELLLSVQQARSYDSYLYKFIANTEKGETGENNNNNNNNSSSSTLVEYLAQYPTAGILISVPTEYGMESSIHDKESIVSSTTKEHLPIESILFPIDILPLSKYWRAPILLKSVHISIVLSTFSIVHKIRLIVDSLGYKIGYDAPTISIMCGASMNSLKDYGIWNIGKDGEGNEGDGTIEGKTVVEYSLKSPTTCRIIQLSVSIPDIPNTSNFIHLGRLQVIGKLASSNILAHSNLFLPSSPIPSISNPLLSNNPQNSPTTLTSNDFPSSPSSSSPITFNSPIVKKSSISPSDRSAYEKIYNTPSPVSRSQIKPLWAQYRSGRKILDMCIDPVIISGFSVLIRHGEEGYKTQVKQIRVVGITTDQRGEMVSLRQICKLVIPLLSKPSAELIYDFSSPTVANIVTFEFLSNYGGQELVPPKVALLTQSQL